MVRSVLLLLLGALFVTAGITHFTATGFFLQIVPPFLPAPLAIVYVSGVFEILLGILVLLPATRAAAARGLVVLLLAVFPANVYMAVANLQLHDPPVWMGQPTPLQLWLRLPLQFVLVAWAWTYTRPGRRARLSPE